MSDNNRDLLTAIAFMRAAPAHLAAPHLVEFAAKMGVLLDDAGLSVNRVRRIP